MTTINDVETGMIPEPKPRGTHYEDTAVCQAKRLEFMEPVMAVLASESLRAHASAHQQVQVFHRMYDMPRPVKFTPLTVSRMYLRLGLIMEEFQELVNASGFMISASSGSTEADDGLPATLGLDHEESKKADYIEIVDALGDLIYVIYGMAIEMGINLEPALQEIHASNLTKLGLDGKPMLRADGKILKGPGYVAPNLLAWYPEIQDYQEKLGA